MESIRALMWGSSCVGILLSLALVAVALVKVRKANSGAGLMLAGSGATSLLTVCCTRGVGMYAEDGRIGASLWTVQSLLSVLASLIATALIIAGFVVLARAGKPVAAGGREA